LIVRNGEDFRPEYELDREKNRTKAKRYAWNKFGFNSEKAFNNSILDEKGDS